MEFIVPKFINREPKIMGPLTFKQFIFLAIPGFISFMLYFILKKSNFALFILTTIVLMGGGVAFSFLKIKGYPLPIFLKNLIIFSLSTRKFIWSRKIIPPKVQKMEKMEQKVETRQLKIAGRSNLQKISVDIETRKK